MANAIGGGLIGWGAILLASTLVFRAAGSSVAELERTGRNTRAATALSIISSAVGAVIILVNHEWAFALAGLAVGVAVYYVVQVTLTYRTWRALAAQVALERRNLDGRITIETAGRLGLWSIGVDAPAALPMMAIEGSGNAARALVDERARLSWAMRHPVAAAPLKGPSGRHAGAAKPPSRRCLCRACPLAGSRLAEGGQRSRAALGRSRRCTARRRRSRRRLGAAHPRDRRPIALHGERPPAGTGMRPRAAGALARPRRGRNERAATHRSRAALRL